jgi:uncharacterized membrane protein YedE/YeeE
MISSFSQRPLSYFVLLAMPFAALFGVVAVNALMHLDRLTKYKSWGNVALFTTLVLVMICVYFVMLGLLAELTVKASGMHRSRSHSPLSR